VTEGRSSTSTILVAVIVVAAVVLVGIVTFAVVIRDDSSGDARTTSTTQGPTTTSAAPATSRPEGSSSTAVPIVDVVSHDVQMGLLQRQYTTVTPLDVAPGERLPMVMALHGLGQDRNAMLNAADWRGAVARDRFIAVFPQGVANSWNMGPCCPPANLLGIDDLAFLDAVVAQVGVRPDADTGRRYITGFSNGGIMAYSEVCARPGVWLALAPVSGSNLSGCAPSEPISLLHQHGDPDPVVPFDGQPALGQLLSSGKLPSVPDSVAAWAAADGCPTPPEVVAESSGVQRTEWAPCADGTRVELVRLPGLGHAWPKKGDYDGLQSMLEFFELR
jgi:polyhydroxybutyrate depolymerase